MPLAAADPADLGANVPQPVRPPSEAGFAGREAPGPDREGASGAPAAIPPGPVAIAAAPGSTQPILAPRRSLDLPLRERIAAAVPDEGAVIFDQRCADCHVVGNGELGFLGPNLFGVVGRGIASAEAFPYSAAFLALRQGEAVWDYETLDAFLMAPRTAIPGTRMVVGDIPDAFDRAALIAFLRLQALTPPPIEGVAIQDADLRPPPSFTAEQADRGRGSYRANNCAFCHGEDLAGLFDFRGSEYGGGPALTGGRFLQTWRTNGLDALFATIQTRMPPEQPGSLSAAEVADLLAYILSVNGFTADGVELSPDPNALATRSLRQGR